MNILVTGAAGFIASHVIERLLESGNNKIMGIDNFATGRRDTVEELKKKGGDRFIFSEMDIGETGKYPSTGLAVVDEPDPDIVIHAAASYKNPAEWVVDAQSNVVGTANLMEACKNSSVKRIIYFQTSLCYGLHPQEQPITINHPVRPEGSTYAITKTAAEDIIKMSGVPYTSFRLANCYGPRNLSGPVPTFYQRLTQGKECFVMNTRRDFVFVQDLVDIVVRAIEAGADAPNGPYHVSSGSDYAIEEMYQCVREALGKEPMPVCVLERSADDVATLILDPSQTHKAFPGWKTTVPLEEGIMKAVAWYQTHEFGETFTHLKINK